jgi:hypothetical protein
MEVAMSELACPTTTILPAQEAPPLSPRMTYAPEMVVTHDGTTLFGRERDDMEDETAIVIRAAIDLSTAHEPFVWAAVPHMPEARAFATGRLLAEGWRSGQIAHLVPRIIEAARQRLLRLSATRTPDQDKI